MSTIARTKVKELLKAEPGREVLAKGWVRTKRGNKQIKFIALNDGSTVHNIQVVADMANFDESLIATGKSSNTVDIGVDRVYSGSWVPGRNRAIIRPWSSWGPIT